MQSITQPRLVFGQVEVHLEDLWIRRGEEEHDPLTPTEAKLLGRLAMEMGGPVDREDLLADVWEYHPHTQTRTVDATVRRLRSKIEQDPGCPEHLLTVRGQGYRLVTGEGTRIERGVTPTIPQFSDPWVGREQEMESLAESMSDHRGVSLVGPPGCGKSRLAVEWLNRFGEGPGAFCDLAGVSDLESAVVHVAWALNLPLLEGASRDGYPQMVGRCLRRSGIRWLVLDNLEGVRGLERVLTSWLSDAPDLRVLLTSRERRRLPAVQSLEIGPMGQDDAIALFRQRAGLDGGGPLRSNVVARIVDKLDRLPLAIDLAARRVPVLGLEALQERLDKPLELIGEGDDANSPGLRAVLQASWATLDDDERVVLSWCALFRSGFNAALVEGVMGDSAADMNWMNCLASLQAKSLILSRDPAVGSLRLLEVVRQFALEKARGMGHEDVALERFAPALVEWAEGWHQRSDPSMALVAQRHLLSQADNLHWAMSLATDPVWTLRLARVLDPVLEAAGPHSLLVDVLSQALDRVGGVVSANTVDLVCRRGCAFRAQGLLERARQDAEMALAWAEGHEVADQAARATVLLASVDWRQGHLIQAEQRYHQAIEWAKICSDLSCEAQAWAGLGAVLTQGMRLAESKAAMENAVFKNPGDWRLEASVAVDMGLLERQRGHWDEARVYLERGVALYEAAGFDLEKAKAKSNLGIIELEAGQLAVSERLLGEAIREFHVAGDRRSEGQTLGRMAVLYRRQARFFEAEACLRQALMAHREIGSRRSEGVCENNLALLCIDRGRLDHAIVHLDRALAIHSELQDRRSEMIALVNTASIAMEQERVSEAIQVLKPLCEEAVAIGDRPLSGVCCFNLGLAYHLAGDLEAARKAYGMAIHWAGVGVEGLDAKMFGALAILELGYREQAVQWLDDVRGALSAGQYPVRDAMLRLCEGRIDLNGVGLVSDTDSVSEHLHHSQDLRFARRLVTM